VPGVYVVAETIHLPLDVEIDLLVPDVDGRGGDDELGAKALALDAHPLELGLDAVQGGKERELKNLFAGEAPQGLAIAVQNRAPQVLADPKLDGNVEAATERISVGSGEKEDTQKPNHGTDPSFDEYNMNERLFLG
jgi:hypothetical protein